MGTISRRLIRNNKGQLAVEAVLLMTVLLGAFALLTKHLKERETIQNLTETSVKHMRYMSQQGTWNEECRPIKGPGRERAGNCHPNSINRALSSDPQ